MVNAEIRLIMFFAAEDGEALCSQKKKTRLSSDMAQMSNALKKTSALNWRKYGKPLDHLGWPKSIPYDYTVDVTNRFEGLDLIDRLLGELWTKGHDILHETMKKTIPKKNKCKKAKGLSEEALQIT